MPVVPALQTRSYLGYEELCQYLYGVAEAAPHLVRLQAIGASRQGRPLLLAEVTNLSTGEARDKPALWVDGNIHPAGLVGSMACLELLHRLASGHGRDELLTWILDTRVLYILPRMDPDGAERCLTTGGWMGGLVEPEEEGWGLIPGDVDGDGRILQMRIKDPRGEWKPSRRDPRLLLRRAPDDRQGPFYRLYREGLYREGRLAGPGDAAAPAGSPLEVGPVGDRRLSQNFPLDWRPAPTQPGAGPYPLSEPESRAVADFLRDHPNLCAAVSLHGSGAATLRPYSARPEVEMPLGDRRLYRRFGPRFSELTGAPFRVASRFQREGSGPVRHGAFEDWAYHERGLLAFSVGLWSLARAAGLEDPEGSEPGSEVERSEADQLAILRWLDRELEGQGFRPWTPFLHPQLGAVEIGGWEHLTTWLNPPPGDHLAEELRRAGDLVLSVAAALPRLAAPVSQEELLGWAEEAAGEGAAGASPPLRKITAEVVNEGYLSTWVTEQARVAGLSAPVVVELELSGEAELVVGASPAKIPALSGSGTVHTGLEADAVWFGGASEGQRARLEWLVRGEGAVALRIRHPRAGAVRVPVRGAGPEASTSGALSGLPVGRPQLREGAPPRVASLSTPGAPPPPGGEVLTAGAPQAAPLEGLREPGAPPPELPGYRPSVRPAAAPAPGGEPARSRGLEGGPSEPRPIYRAAPGARPSGPAPLSPRGPEPRGESPLRKEGTPRELPAGKILGNVGGRAPGPAASPPLEPGASPPPAGPGAPPPGAPAPPAGPSRIPQPLLLRRPREEKKD